MNSDFENKISQEMMSTDSATSGSERHIHPRTRTLIVCAALATLILAISWGMFHRADSRAFSGDKAQGVDSLSTAWGTEARWLSPQSALAHGVEKPALSYADLPLRFEQNQAQASESARFVAAGRGYRVSLPPASSTLRFHPPGSQQTLTACSLGTNSSLEAQAWHFCCARCARSDRRAVPSESARCGRKSRRSDAGPGTDGQCDFLL